MLRWHGRIQASAIDDEAVTANPFDVQLYGTLLRCGDESLIHARLAADDWAVETVRSALVYGVCRGRGQLWLPDAQARVTPQPGQRNAQDLILQRQLRVHTRLSREELMERLLDAFSDDSYIDARVLAAAIAREATGRRADQATSADHSA